MTWSIFGLGRPSADAPNRVGPVQAEILQIIRDFPEKAHGVGIAEVLRGRHGDTFSDAQTYIALKRLDVRGLVAVSDDNRTRVEETTPSKAQRGRPRIYYTLTASGWRALEDGAAINSSGEYSGAQPRRNLESAIKKRPTLVG